MSLDIAPHALNALLAIAALLILATAICWPPAAAKTMERALASGADLVVIVGLFAVSILLKPVVTIALLGFISFLAFKNTCP